jgi:fatty acid-binding protein DegV
VRTKGKAIEAMIAGFFERMDRSRPIRVAVLHGNVPDEVKALADRIQRDYNPVEVVIGLTSPVMGVHTGPGALALCGYYED